MAENVYLRREQLGTETSGAACAGCTSRDARAKSREAFERFGVTLPPVRTKAARLSGGQRQAVAITRAVMWGSHIVLMDEPAAALGVKQTELVLSLVERLKSHGVAIVFISHNMQHVLRVADRVAVMRLGEKVADFDVHEQTTGTDLVGADDRGGAATSAGESCREDRRLQRRVERRAGRADPLHGQHRPSALRGVDRAALPRRPEARRAGTEGAARRDVRRRRIRGSRAAVSTRLVRHRRARAAELDAGGRFAVSAWLFPTTPGSGPQGIVTKWSEGERRGWGLFLEADGDLGLRIDGETFRTGRPCARSRGRSSPRRSTASASGSSSGRCCASLERACRGRRRARLASAGGPSRSSARATGRARCGGFNGKLEAPRLERGGAVGRSLGLLARHRERPDPRRSRQRPRRAARQHADARGHGTQLDRARDRLARTRARSTRAVFFHDDDLEDAGWEPAFELDRARTTSRAASTQRGCAPADDEEWIPFFVAPAARRRAARRSRSSRRRSRTSRTRTSTRQTGNPVAVTDFVLSDYFLPEDRLAIDVPLLGLYDKHRDGVGCCYSSRLRPVVNMRPHYHLALVRSAHQLLGRPPPRRLARGEGLRRRRRHRRGPARRGDRALCAATGSCVTGSHPEYWTARMLESLAAYLEQRRPGHVPRRQRLLLGDVRRPGRPHVIEVRRGRRGTGTWRGEPGEDFHSTTGEPGGLWRDRGCPPQRLVGVGMAAQGFDRALPFEREAGAATLARAWIFEGVPEGPIGDAGLMMDGAAGLEVDRLDHALGTPPHALLLATARGFSDSYQHVVEEVASSDSRQGGTVSPFVRGDMAFFELPNGGAVFSASSISWCGSLSHNGYDNAVSQITENVLRRFAADAPVNEIAASTGRLERQSVRLSGAQKGSARRIAQFAAEGARRSGYRASIRRPRPNRGRARRRRARAADGRPRRGAGGGGDRPCMRRLGRP